MNTSGPVDSVDKAPWQASHPWGDGQRSDVPVVERDRRISSMDSKISEHETIFVEQFPELHSATGDVRWADTVIRELSRVDLILKSTSMLRIYLT